jgi:hypothetical protein
MSAAQCDESPTHSTASLANCVLSVGLHCSVPCREAQEAAAAAEKERQQQQEKKGRRSAKNFKLISFGAPSKDFAKSSLLLQQPVPL